MTFFPPPILDTELPILHRPKNNQLPEERILGELTTGSVGILGSDLYFRSTWRVSRSSLPSVVVRIVTKRVFTGTS